VRKLAKPVDSDAGRCGREYPSVLDPHVIQANLRVLQQTGEFVLYRRDSRLRQLRSFPITEGEAEDCESGECPRRPPDPLQTEPKLSESFLAPDPRGAVSHTRYAYGALSGRGRLRSDRLSAPAAGTFSPIAGTPVPAG
jgi:hypothetical protein